MTRETKSSLIHEIAAYRNHAENIGFCGEPHDVKRIGRIDEDEFVARRWYKSRMPQMQALARYYREIYFGPEWRHTPFEDIDMSV